MKILPLITLATMALGTSLMVSADEHQRLPAAAYDSDYDSALAGKVRAATAEYRNINIAHAAGYSVPATTCVSGPDHGAMGIHWANPAYLMNPPWNTSCRWRRGSRRTPPTTIRPIRRRRGPPCRQWTAT